MSNRFYAGIGARKTPDNVLKAFEEIGRQLATRGYVLRSGACEGADAAFERGCDLEHGEKEIYLPWKGYNGHPSELYNEAVDPFATEIAKSLHPNWDDTDEKGSRYLTRDVCQVLGGSLDKPCDFIICWTKDGRFIGGTAMAMRVAVDNGIKIFNAGLYSHSMWDDTKYPRFGGRSKFIEEVIGYAEYIINKG
ncbi:MAG: hypothetical protein NC548_29675 [Lachnospiraceae bacterium]|nr:hypothetical protein [Lachnospiraceae bacterium]